MTVLIRCDVHFLPTERIEQIQDWVRTLGVKPEDVRPEIAIVKRDATYELHLSEFVRNQQGQVTFDLATENVVTRPLVVDLGSSAFWPAWLAEHAIT